jgi:hypothetical protein
VSTGQISTLYRVSLLCGDSVESQARRGKSLRKVPVPISWVVLQHCTLLEKSAKIYLKISSLSYHKYSVKAYKS